jgi:hypothetical protein
LVSNGIKSHFWPCHFGVLRPKPVEISRFWFTVNPLRIIRIRQQKTNLKQFCLRDFTPAISAISIILQARAIRFPVAILLPEML